MNNNTQADSYLSDVNVAASSKAGEVDPDFDLGGRLTLRVDDEGKRYVAPLDESLLLASETAEGTHRPVIDIDIPARLIPSSTPGHAHLYLDVDLSWKTYLKLLEALNEAGVIETGYLLASEMRQATQVRLPWVKKAANEETS